MTTQLMFHFISNNSESVNNTKSFVNELNSYLHSNYMTGLSAGLLQNHNIFIVNVALDENAIQSDNKITTEIITSIVKLAEKYQANLIIDFRNISESKQTEVFAKFLKCNLIQSFVEGDDVDKIFQNFNV